ncbi:MAG: histidine kinase dimerization/phospho-acceptor domain-containing protein [Coprococcus sp.]
MERDIKLTKPRRLTLGIKLLIVIIGGLAIATSLFFLNAYIVVAYLQNVYLSEENVKERNSDYIDSFADYVKRNKVASSDMKSILSWQEQEENVYILVYENEDIIFDSTWWTNRPSRNFMDRFVVRDKNTGDVVISETEKKEILRQIKLKREEGNAKNNSKNTTETTEEYSEEATESDSIEETESVSTEQKVKNESKKSDVDKLHEPYYIETEDSETHETQQYGFYPIKFADGIYDVCILDYSESTVYGYGLAVAFFISCIMMVMIIVIYHRREIRRIVRLTNEVKNIESYDINGDISLKGRDEIADLSDSIDRMRTTIVDQMGKEKAAWQANSDLVTSMAHDIRTPLTVLAGYLDLIKNKDYSSEEELLQYIEISADKAEQLRDLSDKLFRYFYVYTKSDDTLEFEEFDAAGLFDQLITEYVILLEEKGFNFKIDTGKRDAIIKVDMQYLKRLTDNIFTNVRKYADKSKPVYIINSIHKDRIHLKVKNEISKDRNNAESTRIGLQTCEKIAEQLGGRFWSEGKNSVFTAHLELPVIKSDIAKEDAKKEKTHE